MLSVPSTSVALPTQHRIYLAARFMKLTQFKTLLSSQSGRGMATNLAAILACSSCFLGVGLRSQAVAQTTPEPAEPAIAEVYTVPVKPLELPGLDGPHQFLPGVEKLIRLEIRLSERRVYVYEDEAEVANYPIAIGKAGWETPTGEFEVLEKLKDPAWQHPFKPLVIPPGPQNPLGSRWIGFWTDGTNYIGFHGTPNTKSVGRPASHGCIRMFDRDVQKLFEIVQVGTPVTVVN